jgi:hypothetical protein
LIFEIISFGLDAVYIILELETEPKRKISQVLIIILINTIKY